MSLYKYFTTDCDTVCKAYGRPSERKKAIECYLKGEMRNQFEGRRYRVLSHNVHFFTCAYMYTDSIGWDVVRVHTPSTSYDVPIYWTIPEVIPVIGADGLPTDKYRMSLTIDYEGGSLSIPYHELAEDYKPIFAEYIQEFGNPIR